MVKKQKIAAKQIDYRLIAIGAAVVLLIVFGIVLSQIKTKGYNSKAAGVDINCKQVCDEKLPNASKYTKDCNAKKAAGDAEPCGCEKACLKVMKAINEKNMGCQEACTTQLRPVRGQICTKTLCPLIDGTGGEQTAPTTQEQPIQPAP